MPYFRHNQISILSRSSFGLYLFNLCVFYFHSKVSPHKNIALAPAKLHFLPKIALENDRNKNYLRDERAPKAFPDGAKSFFA